jgi:NADH kinase
MIRTSLRARRAHIQIATPSKRLFTLSSRRCEIRDIAELPARTRPTYQGDTSFLVGLTRTATTDNHAEINHNDLLCLQWPSPPRNILITKKINSPRITEALIEYTKHIHSSYPDISFILEPHAAEEVHKSLPFPVYTAAPTKDDAVPALHEKIDLITTLGGDGTILHASSLFATARNVPPILSFSMGTLGFLGEWKFKEYKRAFREVYMSGATVGNDSYLGENEAANADTQERRSDAGPHEVHGTPTGWASIRGKSMGSNRGARVLLRNRLKVGIFGPDGQRISGDDSIASSKSDVYAMNEVIMHRGATPHLAIIEVSIGGRFLTEAVADGMIISTPTGSTAYSLSSGGSIVHPLVSSLLLTPICPRSLSFRPLVLPANTPISLRLSEKNRGREVEVSIDGVRRSQGLGLGMEVRVWGETIKDRQGKWTGGVPSVVRGAVGSDVSGEDHWVGGLNGLLKFNYPFGEGA